MKSGNKFATSLTDEEQHQKFHIGLAMDKHLSFTDNKFPVFKLCHLILQGSDQEMLLHIYWLAV